MMKPLNSQFSRFAASTALLVGMSAAFGACSSDDGGSSVGNTPTNTGGKQGSSTGGSNGNGVTGGTTSTQKGGTTGTGATGAGTGTGTGGSGRGVQACSGLPMTSGGGAGGEQACTGVSLEAEAVDVDLFIMMDRSMSMGYSVQGVSQTRWQALRTAVDQFVKSPEAAKLSAGIGFFNLSGGQEDTLDCDVSKYAQPKVEIGLMSAVGNQLVAAMDAITPGGLTPSVPALQGALNHAKTWAATHANHATVVLLVTDGYPTQCSARAPGDVAAVAEAAYLASPSIRTFVIGVGDVARFNLDNYARAGGTRQAYLTSDDKDMTQTFVKALLSITNADLACEYVIPPPPSSEEKIDTEKVSVIYTPQGAGAEEVPRVTSFADCAKNPNGGWYYDNPADPKKISVCPCTCSRFGVGRVDVRLGCAPRIGIR